MRGIFKVTYWYRYSFDRDGDREALRVLARDAEHAIARARAHKLQETGDLTDDDGKKTGKKWKITAWRLVGVEMEAEADL